MITFLNGKLFQKLSEQVILDCKISSNPKSEISWFRGETKIVNSNKFIIENLDHSNSRLYINVKFLNKILKNIFLFEKIVISLESGQRRLF